MKTYEDNLISYPGSLHNQGTTPKIVMADYAIA